MSEQEEPSKTQQTVHKIESFSDQICKAFYLMTFDEFDISDGAATSKILKMAKIWTILAPKRSWENIIIVWWNVDYNSKNSQGPFLH